MVHLTVPRLTYLQFRSSTSHKLVLPTHSAQFHHIHRHIPQISARMPAIRQNAVESRIQAAIEYLEANPDVSTRAAAREFKVPRTRLRRRLDKVPPLNARPPSHTKLSQPEEVALCTYIDRLDNINLAVRREFVVDAANSILRERASSAEKANPPTVGHNWVSRFLKRHGYITTTQKKLDANRQIAEDINTVHEWYLKLHEVVAKEGILAEDIWNMDETGFQLGIGKDHLIITKRKKAHFFGLLENRESAIAIEAISAGG